MEEVKVFEELEKTKLPKREEIEETIKCLDKAKKLVKMAEIFAD